SPFCFNTYRYHRDLHSFPTRRSSDLKIDGEAFDGGTGNDYDLKLGSNTFIPGFESGIVGHKAGEAFDVEVEFPKDYHAANLKGKDRKSTRLNSSHVKISYAVFCLKKK